MIQLFSDVNTSNLNHLPTANVNCGSITFNRPRLIGAKVLELSPSGPLWNFMA